MKNIVIQLICPDQKGIVAQLTSILYESNNNILSMEQYVDKENERFYIRVLAEGEYENDSKNISNIGALSKKLNGKSFLFNADKE